MPVPVSLDHLCFLDLTPPALVEVAAASGFAQVGLRLHPAAPQERQHPMRGDSPMLRETLSRLEATGVAVFDIGVFRLSPQMDLEAMEAVMESAALLGARHVVVNGDDPDPLLLAALLFSLCERGHRYGLSMNLEPTPWSGVPTPGSGAAVVTACGHPDARLLVDLLHADRSGATAQDLAALPAALMAYVQVCDAPAARPTSVDALIHQARNERAYPGDGELEPAAMLAHLPAGLPLSLEAPVASLSKRLGRLQQAQHARACMDRLLLQIGAAWGGPFSDAGPASTPSRELPSTVPAPQRP